jgi:hypothetical protein
MACHRAILRLPCAQTMLTLSLPYRGQAPSPNLHTYFRSIKVLRVSPILLRDNHLCESQLPLHMSESSYRGLPGQCGVVPYDVDG